MRVLADGRATAAQHEIKIGPGIGAHDMAVVQLGIAAVGGRDVGDPCSLTAGDFLI